MRSLVISLVLGSLVVFLGCATELDKSNMKVGQKAYTEKAYSECLIYKQTWQCNKIYRK